MAITTYNFIKVHIFWVGHINMTKYPNFFLNLLGNLIQLKFGDIVIFLWPSQNIWTLTYLLIEILSSFYLFQIADPASASSIVASPEADETTKATFLPLTTADRKSLLPIHFLTGNEAGNEEVLLRQWLDVCATENGLVVAQQKIIKPPLIVAQMTEEWLNHYRKLA